MTESSQKQPSFRSGADDPIESIELLGKKIINVHAQNADENGKGCGLADGIIDYNEVVQKLADIGYDGYLEVEFIHGENKLSALQRDRDFLVSLTDTIAYSSNQNI